VVFFSQIFSISSRAVPQIVILGPPASGKRSIGKMVASKLHCTHLTQENIIEEADTALKNKATELLKAKQEIPVELWGDLMKCRLQVFDCVKKGWLLDGFPHTREQAIALASLGIFPKHCSESLASFPLATIS
jgi:adenylate kinase